MGGKRLYQKLGLNVYLSVKVISIMMNDIFITLKKIIIKKLLIILFSNIHYFIQTIYLKIKKKGKIHFTVVWFKVDFVNIAINHFTS